MITLPAAFTTVLESRGTDELALVLDFTAPTAHPTLGATVLRIHLGAGDLVVGTTTYSADNGGFGNVESHLLQSLPSFELRLQNVDKVWTARRKAGPLNKSRVDIFLVARSQLSDPTAQVQLLSWYVSGMRTSALWSIFRLGTPFNVLGLDSPITPLWSPFCTFVYKGMHCKSQSAHLKCSKTIPACRDRFAAADPLRHSHGPDFENVSRRL